VAPHIFKKCAKGINQLFEEMFLARNIKRATIKIQDGRYFGFLPHFTLKTSGYSCIVSL
jgi:hypothetical protein